MTGCVYKQTAAVQQETGRGVDRSRVCLRVEVEWRTDVAKL